MVVRTTHKPRASPVSGRGVGVGPGVAKTGGFGEDDLEIGASVCCRGSIAHSNANTYKQIIAMTRFIKLVVGGWRLVVGG